MQVENSGQVKSLQYLNKYLSKYRWRLLLGILFTIISNLFAIYPAQIIRKAFDLVADNVEKVKAASGNIKEVLTADLSEQLLFFAGLVLLLAFLKGFFLYLMRQTIIVMSRFIEFDLKNEIFEHYQKLDLSFYKKNNTGDLMNRISEDVSRVRMYFGPAIMYTINLIVLFVLVVVTMLSINVKLTLYVLTPLPFLSLGIYYVSNIINRKSERVQNQLSNLSTFVQEAFSGIRVIKAFNQTEIKGKQFEEECETYRAKSLELVKVNAIFHPLMILLIGLSTILTVFIGGKLSISGEVSTGNIAEFVIYVNMLTWPVAALGWVTSLVQRAAASQERINEFLKTKPSIENKVEQEHIVKGSIEFRNVSFAYKGSGIQALSNVNFKIHPGESLAILGKTGSGKSTIANLIGRLYEVDSGEIRIDGKPIDSINLNSLRQNIGYVPQEDFLFSQSIKNNIAFGTNNGLELEDEFTEIELAAKLAHVEHNIHSFPEQYETMVGERGITLSGGQKQRISIARALIRKPSILILDDSLSAVDTETEEKIITNLKNEIKNKSTIIISHRVSAAMHCDRIIFLEDGEIIEGGSHAQLIQQKGRYFHLYNKQLKEAKQESLV